MVIFSGEISVEMQMITIASTANREISPKKRRLQHRKRPLKMKLSDKEKKEREKDKRKLD